MEKLSLGLLRNARRRRHITVEDAAATVGKERSFIWRIESGVTDIKVGTLLKLLDRYGKSVTDVFVRVIPKGAPEDDDV